MNDYYADDGFSAMFARHYGLTPEQHLARLRERAEAGVDQDGDTSPKEDEEEYEDEYGWEGPTCFVCDSVGHDGYNCRVGDAPYDPRDHMIYPNDCQRCGSCTHDTSTCSYDPKEG